jgi:hypothetical protein
MTVPEALELVRGVGEVEIHGGNLKLRYPQEERARLQPAIATLRECKAEALAVLAENPPAPKVLPDPTPQELAQASSVLAKSGIRLMRVDGVDYVGIWSDLDGPEVRAALRTYGSGQVLVRYLDGDSIPMKYKWRKVPGEPVPANVLAAMEQEPNQPWVVRDRMLDEMGWSPNGIPWAEWRTQSLNKLFQKQGVIKEPGKITAATVRHGLKRNSSNGTNDRKET